MSPTSPARAIHESIEQRRETSLAQRVLTPSPHTANLKKASKPSKSASRGKPSQESHSTFRTSNYSQQPKVHTTTISNIVRLGDGEDFDDQTDDEMVEEEEFHGLSEARHLFSGKDLPDFVLRRPTGGLTRNVVFRPRNQPDGDFLDGELVFEFWDKEKTRGFWTLRDDVGFGWIVKYSLQDRGYRAWMGVEFGFDQRCLAYPQGQKQSSETQRRASRSTVVEDSEESEVELIDNRRTFRKRNIDQVHPYTTEKSNYKRSRYGKRKENFKKEYTSGASPGLSVPISVTKGRAERSNGRSRTPPLSKLGAPQTKETSKSRLSSGSTDTKATPSNEPEPVSLERIQNDTTLYVFINSDFEDAPATVYLKSCKDINSLFSIVALVAGIKEDDIRILTVQFDWLPYSIPNTIRMIKGLSDSYEKLIEEVREAPAWRKGGEGRVGVYVNVVLR